MDEGALGRLAPSFLAGGGETGALMRALDWGATPLGEPESWPEAVKILTGVMLGSAQPMFLTWGAERVLLYNDAYAEICRERHPAALGQPFMAVWADILGSVAPTLDAAFAGSPRRGEDIAATLMRDGRPEEAHFSYSYTPLRDGDGPVTGVFCVCAETTERVQAHRRAAFVSQLAERLRTLSDPRQVMAAAAEYTGRALGVGRCGYGEVDAVECRFTVQRDWTDGVMPSLEGSLRLEDFGPLLLESFRAGQTVRLDDPFTDARTRDSREAYAAIGAMRAGVAAPLIKDGRFVAAFYVHQTTPRAWTRDEEDLVREVAERTWTAVEKARAEAALRHSEEQLRLAVESAEIGLWDMDMIGDSLFWPARVKAMFGVSADKTVTLEDFYRGLHPDDLTPVAAAFAAACDPARRALYDVEYRTVGREDGVIRWVAAKGRGIFDEGGVCVRVIGTAIDITRRKADEARLHELNDRLERRIAEALAERKLLADIVEGTDSFVQVADLDYRWLAINGASAREFERIFGIRPRVGQSMLEILDHLPEQRDAVKAIWSRALAGEEFTQTDAFGDPDLDRRYYEMKFNVLRDREGRRIGAFQFVNDVTERLREQHRLHEVEAALRQTQKLEAMGQLTGGVAHDFNNLLTPIIGGLDMLQRRRLGGDLEQRLISGALQAAERAKVLVQRLLAFARRQPLQPTAVDVGQAVAGMGDLIAGAVGPQIRVVVSVAEDLPPAHADANQLEMALLNLSVNARDAMDTGGTLRISATAETAAAGGPLGLKPGRYIRISVADTGAGMDETVLSRAIEPFFSTKGVGKGTGLGLSMVHGLAAQLGGALSISSRKGLGSNVELWLPVSAAAPAGTRGLNPDPSAPRATGVVLLVDDEDTVRASAADMLADLGYAVIQAASAEAALSLLDEGIGVDILVSDHLMPGLTGVELAREAQARRAGLKVLIISGFAEAAGVSPDLARLTKPFRQAELAAKLEALSAS